MKNDRDGEGVHADSSVIDEEAESEGGDRDGEPVRRLAARRERDRGRWQTEGENEVPTPATAFTGPRGRSSRRRCWSCERTAGDRPAPLTRKLIPYRYFGGRVSSRRAFLAAVGAPAVASLAGCLGSPNFGSPTPDDPPKPGADSNPDPRHVYGANNEWSSFGCNASNTHTVEDGKAPVDGVSERWRVEVPQLVRHEPLAAGGRVYWLDPGDGLVVYDAKNADELWRVADARRLPLVREGTVYVGVQNRLLALDPKTGGEKWARTLDGSHYVETPSTYNGDNIYVPVGETLHCLDPKTGETAWSRRLFGRLLGSPAITRGTTSSSPLKPGNSTR